MSNTLLLDLKNRAIHPCHNASTSYPFFWVSPCEIYAENPDGTPVFQESPWEDADVFGLYRYDKPGDDGISYPTWIEDFKDVETADALCAAMNLICSLEHNPSSGTSRNSLPSVDFLNFKKALTLLD